MPLFRRKPKDDHHAVVRDLSSLPPGDPSFVVICDCGWAGLPHGTLAEAFDEARRHGANVSPEVKVAQEQDMGGLCVFCGAVIEGQGVFLTAHWSEDGKEREQWWTTHRECLLRAMSDDEVFRGPLHDV